MKYRGENPWRTLRRYDRLRLRWAQLPDDERGRIDGAVISIDSRLGRRERAAVLMHELIHFERGITYPAATWRTMEHEEAQVRREVVHRLVPAEQLALLLEERRTVGGVTVADVADEFDVEDRVAREALRLFRVQHRVQRTHAYGRRSVPPAASERRRDAC